MSRHTKEDTPEDIEVVMKSERREKKEKKEKKERSKSKKSKREVVEPAATEAVAADSSDDAAEKPAKKRKREILPDEIAIDVSLPEPASKKAARKLKKAKLNPETEEGDGKPAAVVEDKDASGKRSDFGVWIGNLPWSATKESLRKFLMDNTEITTEQITRVHLPPPTKPVNPNWSTKPLNKGFAYVDFSTELAMYSAIALTETKMDGRALLIKNAKSFEGRPDKPKGEAEQDTGRGAKGAVKSAHPPNKRVFVGNLSFDVTKEDLEAHYSQCGPIEHLQVATFEDSGKCKGYAWVTFGDIEAATSAVKGFIMKTEDEIKREKKGKNKDASDSEDDAVKSNKKRKWLISRLNGREMRCEFAEDATTRYNKRYGKEKEPEAVDGVNPDRWKNFSKDGGRGGKKEWVPRPKVDARTIPSGKAHSNAQRASQAIVPAEGKKMTFE
jgi:RNA recognition motif-containing protein